MHLRYLKDLCEPLDALLYISTDDLEEMFFSDEYGQYLEVRINNATIYVTNDPAKPLSDAYVTGTDGYEHKLSISNTSYETVYHATEWEEQPGCVVSEDLAVVTIQWVTNADTGEKMLQVQADVSQDSANPSLATTSVTVDGPGCLQAAFEQIGYFVTPLAQYDVIWNFENAVPLWSGETKTFEVRSSVKDSFMSIAADHEIDRFGGQGGNSTKLKVNSAKVTFGEY